MLVLALERREHDHRPGAFAVETDAHSEHRHVHEKGEGG
jgi:hypothetical protein